jgi:hypothetical protein
MAWVPDRIARSCGQPGKMAKNGNGLPAIPGAGDDPGIRRRFDQLIQESQTLILVHVRADSPALAGEQNQSLLPSLSRKLPT